MCDSNTVQMETCPDEHAELCQTAAKEGITTTIVYIGRENSGDLDLQDIDISYVTELDEYCYVDGDTVYIIDKSLLNPKSFPSSKVRFVEGRPIFFAYTGKGSVALFIAARIHGVVFKSVY